MGPVEWSTPRKAFVIRQALECREKGGSIRKLCLQKKQQEEEWPSRSVLSVWLEFYDHYLESNPSHNKEKAFEEACRRRGRRNRPGRPPKLDANTLNQLSSGTKASREEPQQSWCERLEVNPVTLQRARKNRQPPVVRGVEAQDREMDSKTKEARQSYGKANQNKPQEYWHLGVFTDEHHLSTAMERKQTIFREYGTRNDPENRQVRPREKKPITLHIAAGISWDSRTDLIFFHDEHYDYADPYFQWKKRKPRRNRKNYEEAYQAWEKEKPIEYEVLPKSTVMTQEYYTEKCLPQYRYLYDFVKYKRPGKGRAFLVEDNVQSYGTRSADSSQPQRYKLSYELEWHPHPAYSPDLNPIEGVWLILNERLKKHQLCDLSVEEFKALVRREWWAVPQAEIKKIISEMPVRCEAVASHPEIHCKSARW
jgi:transposase